MRRNFASIFKILALAFLSSGCSSLLYQPSHIVYFSPKPEDFRKSEYFIPMAEGDQLQAWSLESAGRPSASYNSTLIFFHGNAENLTSHIRTLAWLPAVGVRVFIFSYRGYGQSTGEPSPRKTVEDGLAATAFAAKLYPKDSLSIFGLSLGGAVALRTLMDMPADLKNRIKSVAIEGSFNSYESTAAEVLSSFWLTWPFQWAAYLVLSDRYAPISKLKDYPSELPTLIFHSEADRVIRYSLGTELYRSLPEPNKALLVSASAPHGAMMFWESGKYRKALLEFLAAPKKEIKKLRKRSDFLILE